MKDDRTIFCENIKWLKTKYGLSNQRMATILHISVASLRCLLQGKIPPRMSAAVILHAADFFHYLPADLFNPLEKCTHIPSQRGHHF